MRVGPTLETSSIRSMPQKMDKGLDDGEFESQKGLGIFLFTIASRPALGPT
jgi:hypothetical protein